MNPQVKSPKKLIEVALPLDDINKEAAREKSIRHGHPSTLHLWWARRPLAAARAVIFAQLVNDPSWKWESEHPGEVPPGQLKASWAAKRKQLFELISELVKWENTTDEKLLEKARAEIRKSWKETCELNKDHPQARELFNPDKLPGLHDPFAGGGSIPLEAQRLGLEAVASDLNPVAVLINKAMIEIPPKFANHAPVHPKAAEDLENYSRKWKGAQGLAEDVKRYGAWMREEAQKRIGNLYPKIKVTEETIKNRPDLKGYKNQELTVIAWLWARTVKSPNPAFSHVEVPLVSSFVLSSKKGKEVWVKPIIEGDKYKFEIKTGTPPEGAAEGTKLSRGANFRCLVSGAAIEPSHIYKEAQADRMGERLLAIVAEGNRSRVYLNPTTEHEAIALKASSGWSPDLKMPENPRWFSPPLYGLTAYGDLFTPRQLTALTTFSDLVGEARELARLDAVKAGMSDDGIGLENGGKGATAYGEAVGVYLALAITKLSDRGSTICSWDSSRSSTRNTFGRQAIPMTWDFAEVNSFSDSTGSFSSIIEWESSYVSSINTKINGTAQQNDAACQELCFRKFISTDPPYYDNIGYADLSDFFYVWLRRSLKAVFPSLFATMAVPKTEELVATPYRHGGKDAAEKFFLNGMTQAMRRLAELSHPAAPVTIYYAFKQSETKGDHGTSSTGWETFLEAVLQAGFGLSGTWPMRTELGNRMIGSGTNALASSIVLVCRRRSDDAPSISRRRFIRELNAVLPEALDEMTMGAGNDISPVAPVDLSQAVIGPGMAVFSKYSAVLEADGTPMTVKTALQLINRFFAEDDFDSDTQFCLRWFEQYGWSEGLFGEADVLARAKATGLTGIVEAGVLFSGGGKVRLLKWADYPDNRDPAKNPRMPVWEALHRLINVLKKEGETAAGKLLGSIKDKTEAVRQLAYRLYTLCERRGMAEDARAYNELVTSWSAIEAEAVKVFERQAQLDLNLGGEK